MLPETPLKIVFQCFARPAQAVMRAERLGLAPLVLAGDLDFPVVRHLTEIIRCQLTELRRLNPGLGPQAPVPPLAEGWATPAAGNRSRVGTSRPRL